MRGIVAIAAEVDSYIETCMKVVDAIQVLALYWYFTMVAVHMHRYSHVISDNSSMTTPYINSYRFTFSFLYTISMMMKNVYNIE